jgi:hypothetical protein
VSDPLEVEGELNVAAGRVDWRIRLDNPLALKCWKVVDDSTTCVANLIYICHAAPVFLGFPGLQMGHGASIFLLPLRFDGSRFFFTICAPS